ncbi:MAG TPA: tetratricopeptide repeat protein, partial [Candidatus Hydrogenedentes bacterium]|nr:tetratricopeptide repeat protein [Candidatus Hydrogenedentota bacterium]
FFALADIQEPCVNAPVALVAESDCDRAALLDLRVVYEEENLSGLVAPPEGVYPFAPGDGVVLRAYGRGDAPVQAVWSGDVAGVGETLYVDMDRHKQITVTFQRVERWPDRETPPWYDVPKNKNLYALVGGGNLYGWFAASRDKSRGAGITHLTHKDAFLKPIVHFVALNFEHIFSGVAADNYRASYTPRTDPMRFRVESPGTVRVHWPREGASWDLDSEMTYRFTNDDAIDMEFHTTPGDEAFPQGYAGFMWATYNTHFADHAIFFPGISDEQKGWMRFGPNIAEGGFGGAVAHHGATHLRAEAGASEFNIVTSQAVFFTEPVYYGMIDLSIPRSAQQLSLAYIMMFDQREPIRFAVWNWGNPPENSAWDWQYIVRNPREGERAGYRARLALASINKPEDVLTRFHEWEKSRDEDVSGEKAFSYPDMPVYWAPSSILFNPLVVGECIERVNPDHALKLYRAVLLTMQDEPKVAARMDYLLSREYSNERRLEEWLYIRNHQNHLPDSPLPLLHLGKAYHATGDMDASLDITQKAVNAYWDYPPLHFFYGELMMETGDLASGLEHLTRAVGQDPELAKRAGDVMAGYAEQAREDGDLALAESLFQKAMEIAPKELWNKVYLGEVLELQGRDKEAESLYRSVLLAAPESPYTAQKVDSMYTERGDNAGRVQFWKDICAEHHAAVVPTLHLGMAFFYANDYANAESVLETAHEAHPDNEDILLYLGAARLHVGNIERGVEHVEKAAGENPVLKEPAATVFAARAASAVESGEYALAETLYRRAMALAPEDPWYPVYLGETLDKQGKDTEALTLLVNGMNTEPESPYVANLINDFFVAREDAEGRVATWRDIAAKNPEAKQPKIQLVRAFYEAGRYKHATALVALTPEIKEHPECLLYHCASLLYLDDLDNGAACLLALAAKDASYAAPVGVAFAKRAAKAFENDEFALAARLYRHAMTVAPGDLWHTVRLGEALEELGRTDEALTLYRNVLRAVPDSPYTANLAHEIFLRHNDADGCADFWREIQRLHPDAVTPRFFLVRACYEAGEYAQALAVAEAALEIAPEHDGIRFYQCAARLRLNDIEVGLACIKAVATQDPAYAPRAADVLAQCGEAAAASGDIALAERFFQQAMTMSPADFSYAIRLGGIMEEAGEHAKALHSYTQVLVNAKDAPQTAARLDALLMRHYDAQRRVAVWAGLCEHRPDAALPLLYLGKAYEAAGDNAAASDAYRNALRLDASLTEAKEALKKLKGES